MAVISLSKRISERLQHVAQQRGTSIDELLSKWLDAAESETVGHAPRSASDFYRDAMSKISIGVAAVESRNPDRPIIYVNPAFEALSGYKVEELLGGDSGTFSRTFNPVEKVKKLSLAIDEGRPETVTVSNFRADGTACWVEIQTTPIFDTGGKLTHVIILMTDVTQHVEFEDKAARVETLYSASFELLAEGILLRDMNGNLITCNASAERIVGLTRQQLIEENHTGAIQWEVFREDNTLCPRDEQPTRLAMQGKPQRNVVVGLHRPGFPMLWLRVNSQPVYMPGETSPYAILVSFTDITAEHLAHLQLTESEQRFRLMADYAPVFIWMTDDNNQCTYVNQSWLNFTGRGLEDELGDGWLSGIHPEDQGHVRDIYYKSCAARTNFQLEFRIRRNDGRYGWVADTGRPRYLPDGAFVGYIGSCTDITDLKLAQLELEKANIDLEKRVAMRTEQLRSVYQAALAEQARMNELKTHFLSVVAHEFRNPLAVMKIAAWFLHSPDSEKFSPAQRAEKAIQIEKQIERLTQLVDDVTIAYKLQSASFRLNLSNINLPQIIRTIVEDMCLLEGNASGIHYEMPSKLFVQTDELLIGHILTNLISNALKYSPNGTPITIELKMHKGWLDLIIEDKGIGIPAEDQVNLFEIFHRGQNATSIKGTGLGLTIVKYCVDALAGKITWESQVNVGTTFTVSIPADYALE